MNKIFVFIIVFSFIFGLFTGNLDLMSMALLDVPKKAIISFINLFSIMILYNGLIMIMQKSGILHTLSKLGKNKLKKIFETNDQTLELISLVIWTNLLGLGIGNLPISLKIIRNIEKNKKELITYIFINISSLCIMPISLITLRSSFSSFIIIPFIPLLFITSLITTIVAYIIARKLKEDNT